MTVQFDCEGEIRALRKELGEHEVMFAQDRRRIQNLEHESRDHRDRDVRIMGILRVVSEALETNNKATVTMKKQINKLFSIMKGGPSASKSKP